MSPLEILWIVLAFCALWVAAFICWAVYHIAMVARRVHQVLDDSRAALHHIKDGIAGLKDKIDQHARLLDPIVSMVGSVVREAHKKEGDKAPSLRSG